MNNKMATSAHLSAVQSKTYSINYVGCQMSTRLIGMIPGEAQRVWQSLRAGCPSWLGANPLLKHLLPCLHSGPPEGKALPWRTFGSSINFSDSGISIYKTISIAITILSMARLWPRSENMALSCDHLQLRSDQLCRKGCVLRLAWGGGSSPKVCWRVLPVQPASRLF